MLIDPDNMSMRYNLACDHVITLSDPDFDPIRSDERFQAMIADAERRLAAARNT